jgi:hypothetical protein
MQFPLIEKHPPFRLMPLAAVDVAVVDERLNTAACSPLLNVDVEFPFKYTDAVPTFNCPATSTLPANVDDAATPCTTSACVVVAPPLIVSPVSCVPPPIVDDAVAIRFFNWVMPLSKIAARDCPVESTTSNDFVAAVFPAPAIASRALGVLEPMPTLPVLVTTTSVLVAAPVDDAISNSLEFVSPACAAIDNFANGEDDPTPKLPFDPNHSCDAPSNEPPLLNWICPDTPPGAVAPPAERQMPLIA